MKFSLPFFGRKSAKTARNALQVLPQELPAVAAAPAPVAAPAEETRSRWELAAEQLASMNAAKQEAVAPVPPAPQPEPTRALKPVTAVEAAVAVPVLEPEPLPASPAEQPVAVPDETGDTVGMTREDVVAAYHLFLRRDPESEAVIEPYLGRERERLLGAFLTSAEFLQWPEHLRLVVEVAQAIELRQRVQPPRAGVPLLDAQDLEAARRILQPPLPATPAQELEPALEGQPVDWALACLMRSDAFQRNPFNARLVTGLAHEIAGQLKPQADLGTAEAGSNESLPA